VRIKVTGVVKYGGQWRTPGDVLNDVSDEIGQQMISQDVGEEIKKTPEEIAAEESAKAAAEAAKTAEKELKALRKKAEKLGIEGFAEKDAETLTADIAAAEEANKGDK
jgi:hypothetical protein